MTDLGEDGQLVASNLRSVAKRERHNGNPELAAVIDQAADRLILYREALTGLLASCSSKPVGGGDGGTHYVTGPSVEAMRKARDVLSRSEAQPRSASS